MPILKKAYRFAAVFTLLLLASNILLPAGAAAVNLYCDMDMEAHSMHDCCDDFEKNHSQRSVDADDCLILSFCEQVVESEQSDVPAVFQHIKIVLAANLTDTLDTILPDDEGPEFIRDQSVQQEYTAPIFILNSVFLN